MQIQWHAYHWIRYYSKGRSSAGHTITDAPKSKLLMHAKGLSDDGLANVESWLSIAANSTATARKARGYS
jgi:hypothetical protein